MVEGLPMIGRHGSMECEAAGLMASSARKSDEQSCSALFLLGQCWIPAVGYCRWPHLGDNVS